MKKQILLFIISPCIFLFNSLQGQECLPETRVDDVAENKAAAKVLKYYCIDKGVMIKAAKGMFGSSTYMKGDYLRHVFIREWNDWNNENGGQTRNAFVAVGVKSETGECKVVVLRLHGYSLGGGKWGTSNVTDMFGGMYGTESEGLALWKKYFNDNANCDCILKTNDWLSTGVTSNPVTTTTPEATKTEPANQTSSQTTAEPKKNIAPAPKTTTKKVTGNPKPDGPFELKDESGQVQQSGTYKNQKKQGVWKTYTDGKVYLEETFIDDIKNGTETKFSDAGGVDYKREYKAGEIVKEQFFENGSLKSDKTYVNGKKSGKCITYYANGSKYIEETYVNGALNGEKIAYSDKGLPTKTETFKDDKLNGPCKKYAEGKLKEEGNYLNGMQDGEWKKYDPKTGKVTEIKTYKDGVPQ